MTETYFPELNEEFLRTLKANLITVFQNNSHLDIDPVDFDGEELWINLGGTVGYGLAFTMVCNSLGLEDLRQYYASLPWDESDHFDSDVLDLAIKYGVVAPMEEIEPNQTGVSLDNQKGNK